MIKYGVLDEYVCEKCGEKIAVPKQAEPEELKKVASVGCAHEFIKSNSEMTEIESPA
jgi:hypothetical protein